MPSCFLQCKLNTSQWKTYVWYQSCLQGDSRCLREFLKTHFQQAEIQDLIYTAGLALISIFTGCSTGELQRNRQKRCWETQGDALQCKIIGYRLVDALHMLTRILCWLWWTTCRSLAPAAQTLSPWDPALRTRTTAPPPRPPKICCWKGSLGHLHHRFNWKGSELPKIYIKTISANPDEVKSAS